MAKSKYKVEFPYMRAFGRMTEIDFMNVQDRLTMAAVENAPWDAISIADGKWIRIQDLPEDERKRVLEYADKFYTSQSRPRMATTTGQPRRILP